MVINDLASLVAAALDALTQFAPNPVLAGLLLFSLTTIVIASGLPGVTIPLAATSGLLLGAVPGTAIVCLGTIAGSQIMFMSARHLARPRFLRLMEGRMLPVQNAFERHGVWYVIASRVLGTPHVIVTGACAFLPINGLKFALATFLGFAPVVCLAAFAGAALGSA